MDSYPLAISCMIRDCTNTSVPDQPEPLCGSHLDRLLLALFPDAMLKFPPSHWLRTYSEHFKTYGLPTTVPDWLERLGEPASTPPERHRTKKLVHEPLVYFYRAGDLVKIGHSANIIERFGNMIPPDADILVMYGDINTELALHRSFPEERIPNTEWFRRSARIELEIARLVSSRDAMPLRAFLEAFREIKAEVEAEYAGRR